MNFTPEQLARMAHSDLMLQRGLARQSNNMPLDQQLAPFEHQAFAREYVGGASNFWGTWNRSSDTVVPVE